MGYPPGLRLSWQRAGAWESSRAALERVLLGLPDFFAACRRYRIPRWYRLRDPHPHPALQPAGLLASCKSRRLMRRDPRTWLLISIIAAWSRFNQRSPRSIPRHLLLGESYRYRINIILRPRLNLINGHTGIQLGHADFMAVGYHAKAHAALSSASRTARSSRLLHTATGRGVRSLSVCAVGGSISSLCGATTGIVTLVRRDYPGHFSDE
jgi:hypothetical protein